MSEVINGFMERYNKEFDFYLNLSNKVESEIRTKLDSFGVRAIVSSRAKSPKRLRDKIIDRDSRNSYKSIEDIYKDIIDLAGVRVAIYFPGDLLKVDELIKAEFILDDEPKTFPERRKNSRAISGYQKVFSGYAARHFRVKIKGSGRYANNYPVEIQVASVLMHAWSEVEHDLVYKPLQGSLSHEELMILDEINGLVLSGNLALERLQQAGIKRTSEDHYEFKNHYDLASFFISYLADENLDNINFHEVFKIFKAIKKTKRTDLSDIIEWLKKSALQKETIARLKRNGKDPSTHLREEIISAIANIFPEDTVKILEKFSTELFEHIDVQFLDITSLIHHITKHYMNTPSMKFVESIVDNYEFYSEVIYSSKEEAMDSLLEQKGIALLITKEETSEIFEDYIETRKLLNPDSFKKAIIDDLINKNKRIDSIIKKQKSNE